MSAVLARLSRERLLLFGLLLILLLAGIGWLGPFLVDTRLAEIG